MSRGFGFDGLLAFARLVVVAFALSVFVVVVLVLAFDIGRSFVGGQGRQSVGARCRPAIAGVRPARSVNQLHSLQPLDEQVLGVGASGLECPANPTASKGGTFEPLAPSAHALGWCHRLVVERWASHNVSD
jgi:hypothetical protein